MKRFHIAIAVSDVSRSVEDYSQRLEYPPSLVVPGEYALWRTSSLNVSIRRTDEQPGTVRHLGWEDPSAPGFVAERDANGILWEQFSAEQQNREILELWPNAGSIT
jgi:hypothetical protein